MKSTTSGNAITILGLIIALPSAWFILINLLNDAGYSALYVASEPLVNGTGAFFLNALILFGPVVALFLAISQVVKLKIHFTREEYQLGITVHKQWFPLVIVLFSGLLLGILFLYGIAENCNCH